MDKLKIFASISFAFSVPSLLMPLPGNKTLSSTDKYAVFKGIAADKPESTATFAGKRESMQLFWGIYYSISCPVLMLIKS